jgi:hypothetical protein
MNTRPLTEDSDISLRRVPTTNRDRGGGDECGDSRGEESGSVTHGGTVGVLQKPAGNDWRKRLLNEENDQGRYRAAR